MKKDFAIIDLNKPVDLNDDENDSHSVGTSSLSEANNIHKEVKMKIAEKIFEVLKLASINNLPI